MDDLGNCLLFLPIESVHSVVDHDLLVGESWRQAREVVR
jgi:hypothetical protein